MKTISKFELDKLKGKGIVKSNKKPMPKKEAPPKPQATPEAKQMAEAVEAMKQLSASQLDQMQKLMLMVAQKPERDGIKRMNVIRGTDGLIDYVEFE